ARFENLRGPPFASVQTARYVDEKRHFALAIIDDAEIVQARTRVSVHLLRNWNGEQPRLASRAGLDRPEVRPVRPVVRLLRVRDRKRQTHDDGGGGASHARPPPRAAASRRV